MNGYVDAGYAVVLGVLAGYAGRTVLRRRSLERDVRSLSGPQDSRPPEDGAGERPGSETTSTDGVDR